MVSEYRFLRFEIAGLVTLFILFLMLLPVTADFIATGAASKFDISLSIVAASFLVSLPLGYWEHQLVVNQYRSEKKSRRAHQLLKDLILRNPQIMAAFPKENFFQLLNSSVDESSFLTTLFEVLVYAGNDKIHFDSGIFERLSDRWSHFYARRAIALYAPVFAFVLWATVLFVGSYFRWLLNLDITRILLSITAGAVISALNFVFIYPYSDKIWTEINQLESEIILANRDRLISFLPSIVHPDNVTYLKGGK
jgi:hypothetical protein